MLFFPIKIKFPSEVYVHSSWTLVSYKIWVFNDAFELILADAHMERQITLWWNRQGEAFIPKGTLQKLSSMVMVTFCCVTSSASGAMHKKQLQNSKERGTSKTTGYWNTRMLQHIDPKRT